MEGKLVVTIQNNEVFKFEKTIVDLPLEFPGNLTDPQFAAEQVENHGPKFSCSYSGKHDNGDLPPQKRGSLHEKTLLFLQQARDESSAFFVKQLEDPKPRKSEE